MQAGLMLTKVFINTDNILNKETEKTFAMLRHIRCSNETFPFIELARSSLILIYRHLGRKEPATWDIPMDSFSFHAEKGSFSITGRHTNEDEVIRWSIEWRPEEPV